MGRSRAGTHSCIRAHTHTQYFITTSSKVSVCVGGEGDSVKSVKSFGGKLMSRFKGHLPDKQYFNYLKFTDKNLDLDRKWRITAVL